jgi:hypothetical protein
MKDANRVNTSKQFILSQYAEMVAYYDNHKSGHTKNSDAIVNQYREGKLVVRDWDGDTVFMLYVGKQLNTLRWGVEEIPHCRVKELIEDD